MDALTLWSRQWGTCVILDEKDNNVGAAEVKVEVASFPFELVNFWLLFFLDKDDFLYSDVARRDCLVANGTDESSKYSNTVSKKN